MKNRLFLVSLTFAAAFGGMPGTASAGQATRKQCLNYVEHYRAWKQGSPLPAAKTPTG